MNSFLFTSKAQDKPEIKAGSVQQKEQITETLSLLGAFMTFGQLLRLFDDVEHIEETAKTFDTLAAKPALKNITKVCGLSVKFKRLAKGKIDSKSLPLIVKGKDQRWFILAQIESGQYLIQRPDSPTPEQLDDSAFAALYSGDVALISAARSVQGLINKFDIRWFLPELARYRGLAFELLVASAVLQLLALISPLFFQVVMDKVLVHNSISTLDVLVIVLVAVAFFEILLQTLRQYLATRTATRIDARLGSNLYRHLVDLPMAYFKNRSVGVTVMRVNELNSIREFITGAANTLVIDLGFTCIFFAVMYLYSPLLTLIVAASIPCYIAVSFFITGPLQRKIEQQAQDGAINNAFLTETLTGIETVKALALEAKMIRRWEYQTRDFVHSNFKVQQLMQLSGSLVQIILKSTMVLILWIGARMVIDLELSIGQLIAFNMMANHVSQPIIRLTELWRNFVQARVSVERLGDVLNTLPEISDQQRTPEKDIRGELHLEQVTFRYAPDSEAIFENFSLTIPAAKTVAFVGKSGSGKSSLTRLIQKLYVPQTGNIYLDGQNITDLNPVALRQRMSIVLQENFLFNRSVRDNIAIMNPSAPLTEVVTAAKNAGAHEFILALKDGYDTILAEGGASLSGGQRQRIAIARSLITNPSILIFDEATSALDDHSQALIKENMKVIQQGRTVILIAHRLSTVRDCDCIYVLDKGEVIESGTHSQLIKNTQGAYRHLWDLQCSELSYAS